MVLMETTDYDGCGKCLAGVRRLSRKSDASNSPEKQGGQVENAAASVGAHIIGGRTTGRFLAQPTP
jgi:hypothetical protein